MAFLKKIKFKKVKNLVRVLAQRAILTFFTLFGLALIIGGLIFLQYNIFAKKKFPEISEKPIKFEEETYQKVLKTWQEREKKFKETDLKIYSDPFRSI